MFSASAPADFNDHPVVAVWELTQACDLACKHCRASATARRDPAELDTREGKELLEQLAQSGTRLMVLTGGDPTKRPDLGELVRHGAKCGLTISLTPSGTHLMTAPALAALRDAGLSRISVSLDGPDAATHDAFRGVRGSFAHCRRILGDARALGLELQINFTLSRSTLGHLDAMAALAAKLGAARFSVFVVIPTGRAGADLLLDANEVEGALVRLAAIAPKAPFQIRTTGAPHFQRVLFERNGAPAPDRTSRAVGDGNGFVFVSHVGDVYPSGFMPIRAGNVRLQSVASIYRASKLFQRLRDATLVEGKCGACPFKHTCGGSRARAYAATGNELASDPGCAYVPAGFEGVG